MKLYRETDFQETEIGRIPKEWKITNLGSIAKVSSGNTAPQDEKYFENGKYPFIRVQHLTELQEQKYPVKYDLINEYAVSDLKLKKFKKGSIIFPKSGESIKLEKRAILKEDSYVVNHLAVIEPFHESIDNLFLFYYLCTVRTSNYLLKTTMPSLNLSTISNFLVPVPPIKEQQKIAEILSTVDNAIEHVNNVIARLNNLKNALMNELLTGRIRVREENGKLAFYTETDFQETPIGKIPRDWELVKFSNIAEDIYYGMTAKAVENKTELKILRTTDIKNYSVNWDSLPFCEITEKRGDIQRFLLKKGDLIIARAGTTGVSVLVDKDLENVIFGSYLIKVKLNRKVYPKFMHYFCQSHLYWDHITSSQAGSTLKNISLPILKSLNIPLPPSIKEQQKIAEILSTVDNAIGLYYKEKYVLGRLRKGLMDMLLTGRVRVRED